MSLLYILIRSHTHTTVLNANWFKIIKHSAVTPWHLGYVTIVEVYFRQVIFALCFVVSWVELVSFATLQKHISWNDNKILRSFPIFAMESDKKCMHFSCWKKSCKNEPGFAKADNYFYGFVQWEWVSVYFCMKIIISCTIKFLEKNSINKTVIYPVPPFRQIENTDASNTMISSSWSRLPNTITIARVLLDCWCNMCNNKVSIITFSKFPRAKRK